MQCNLSFLNALLIISLLSQIYSQNYEQMFNDIELCLYNDNTNNCTNVKMTSGVYQCCKVKTSGYYLDNTLCSIQVTPISLFKEQMEDKTTKALFKEIFGYSLYNGYNYGYNEYRDYMKIKIDYYCKDGNATSLFGYDTYTNEEINVLQSDNHCLRFIYSDILYNSYATKENCFNSVLTQSSINVGLTCGFFEFTIIYSDRTRDSIKTCNIFNKELINYGKLDDKTKESFESVVNSNKNSSKIVLSYTVDFSDKNGNKLFYDSETETVSSDNLKVNSISISKYLIFLSVLLLL